MGNINWATAVYNRLCNDGHFQLQFIRDAYYADMDIRPDYYRGGQYYSRHILYSSHPAGLGLANSAV
jgi:hypothetical protein